MAPNFCNVPWKLSGELHCDWGKAGHIFAWYIKGSWAHSKNQKRNYIVDKWSLHCVRKSATETILKVRILLLQQIYPFIALSDFYGFPETTYGLDQSSKLELPFVGTSSRNSLILFMDRKWKEIQNRVIKILCAMQYFALYHHLTDISEEILSLMY